jgi:putative aminopeptidase FrvX
MKNKEILQKIRSLAEIPGPVGREERVQKFLETEWKKLGIKTEYDKIGNLYGNIEGKGKHRAIIGHADSIGFLVQHILPSGFVKMAFNTAATNPDARFLAGVPIEFLTSHETSIQGYFGLRSGHLAGIEGKKKPILFSDLFVDLGVDSSKEIHELGIDIGTPAVFATPIVQMQQNVVGKAMDNRVALAIQCILAREIIEMDSKPNLTFISTVQEELGMKGAAAAAKYFNFDEVINLDVGLTGDIPSSEKDYLPTKLGKGPIIVYKDFSIHYSYSLIQRIEETARKNDIIIQKAVFKNYNTDGMYFFMEGIPTSTIAIPCRYTHTNFETLRLSDIKNTISLVLGLLA